MVGDVLSAAILFTNPATGASFSGKGRLLLKEKSASGTGELSFAADPGNTAVGGTALFTAGVPATPELEGARLVGLQPLGKQGEALDGWLGGTLTLTSLSVTEVADTMSWVGECLRDDDGRAYARGLLMPPDHSGAGTISAELLGVQRQDAWSIDSDGAGGLWRRTVRRRRRTGGVGSGSTTMTRARQRGAGGSGQPRPPPLRILRHDRGVSLNPPWLRGLEQPWRLVASPDGAVRMVNRAWLADASFEGVWSHVIDPLYVEATSNPDCPPARSEPVLDLLVLWVLHDVSARSGLEAFLVEQPAWMAVRVAAAARAFGHDNIAALWERMIHGVDLAVQRVWERAEVLRSRGAGRELQQALVVGRHADLNVELVNWLRAHADEFVVD